MYCSFANHRNEFPHNLLLLGVGILNKFDICCSQIGKTEVLSADSFKLFFVGGIGYN